MASNPEPLQGTLDENRRKLVAVLQRERGVIFRDLLVPGPQGTPQQVLLVYLETTADVKRLEENVIRPMFQGLAPGAILGQAPRAVPDLADAARLLNRGSALVQVAGWNQVYSLEVSGLRFRPIEAPQTETSVTGPRESFNEELSSNLMQIRRRLPGSKLHVDGIFVGNDAPVEAVLLYVDQGPTPEMIATIRARLQAVKQDGLQEVEELSEAIADQPVTFFPTVLTTERPDVLVQYLMGGRIGIMMENSPRALVLPTLLLDLFVSPDDFYEWRPYVALLRLFRFIAFNMAIPLPAIYVSVTTYHLQALPTLLTLNLLAQREGAPLPPPVEALIMSLIFEILREASVRLPRSIGPTVSIVGGLVIGDAAIRSGLTSPAMVLVVTATAVAAFSLPSPSLANSATYFRFLLLLLASAFGFFGLLIGYLLVLTNLSGMTSLGVPFTAPLFPFQKNHLLHAIGLRPGAPRGPGAKPTPWLTRAAEDYHEGG